MSRKVIFKTYDQDQLSLLPPSYDDLVPINHPVRIVNTIIEHVDISALEKSYKGGGTSSYHPRMLLKVIIYAYLRNLYSSRKIEQALSENIHFMWLSGQSKPDHNTINDFRGKRLRGHLKKIFHQVVLLLVEQGVISLKDIFVDGTKIEATINQINEALKGKDIDKKVKQKLNYAKKNWPTNMAKYQKQEAILKQRNSYSKTDTDATFMRMKDDHMKNGQLKPAYNLQGSTNNQYLTNYTLAQTTADTTTLKDHVNDHIENYQQTPETLTADAGYGSEENYTDLEAKQITAYVKYNYFHKEEQDKKKGKINPFHPNELYYNKETDTYYCPMGQAMTNIGSYKKKTTLLGCRSCFW